MSVKSQLTLNIIAPGNYYDGSRYFNIMDIDNKYEYAYTVRYTNTVLSTNNVKVVLVTIFMKN